MPCRHPVFATMSLPFKSFCIVSPQSMHTIDSAFITHGVGLGVQTLARENRREYGRLLLELWVNQVLDPGSGDLTGRMDPQKIDVSMLKVG